jgi:hypothetical protein
MWVKPLLCEQSQETDLDTDNEMKYSPTQQRKYGINVDNIFLVAHIESIRSRTQEDIKGK